MDVINTLTSIHQILDNYAEENDWANNSVFPIKTMTRISNAALLIELQSGDAYMVKVTSI